MLNTSAGPKVESLIRSGRKFNAQKEINTGSTVLFHKGKPFFFDEIPGWNVTVSDRVTLLGGLKQPQQSNLRL